MINPVHLVLGDDEFLAERARRDIIDRVREAAPEAAVTLLPASEVTEAELNLHLSPSLFADERIIVITKAQDAGKDAAEVILRAAVDMGPGMTLIVQHTGGGRQAQLAKKLEKIAEKHDASSLKNRDKPGWLTKEFSRHGQRVTPDVTHALLESVGGDLRELASAVSQLVSDTEGDISVESVRRYYSGVAEVSGFDIADLAVAGNVPRAVAQTRHALQLGMSPVAIAAALATKVDAIARMYSTRGKPDARRLGMHPYVAEKTHQIARRWSGESVSDAVIVVAELDAAVKGQGADAEFALENAVRRIAELAR